MPVASDFNSNFTALNAEVRPAGTGGTGQSTFTTGDTLYASATNTLSRLAAGSTGNGLVMIAGVPAWRPVLVEQLTGLTVTNGADATSDWDIAAGAATSEESTVATRMLMVNTTTLTKQVDATWAVGSTLGGLDTGAVANTTYHTHLIMRPDTGVVDALFSLSATAPTMPTSYTKSRRIASFVRTGGVNSALVQDGDFFQLKASVTSVDNAASGTAANTGTLTGLPIGVRFMARVHGISRSTAGLRISDLSVNDEAPATSAAQGATLGSDAGIVTAQVDVMTSTSGTVRYRSSVGGQVFIILLGWFDRRGRG